jgi:hypothetical protein
VTSPLDDIDPAELAAQQLSLRAFRCAKAFAAGNEDEATATARQMESEVATMTAALGEPSASINRALADAKLDLAWVLSGGQLPTSIRLHRHLT